MRAVGGLPVPVPAPYRRTAPTGRTRACRSLIEDARPEPPRGGFAADGAAYAAIGALAMPAWRECVLARRGKARSGSDSLRRRRLVKITAVPLLRRSTRTLSQRCCIRK